MRVYRGQAKTIDADRAVSATLLDRVADERKPAVRVWRPHRQVAFGRRDRRADGYATARKIASERGYPPVEREVGGRAVAYAGSSVAFGRATPLDDPRSGLDVRYESMLADLTAALADLGVTTERGEPPASFCPGTHSLELPEGGKLVGVAQRVRSRVALVAGVLVVSDREALAAVLDPIYDALDVAFDPESVGSVALGGGDCDPETVVRTVERRLVGDADIEVESVSKASGDQREP